MECKSEIIVALHSPHCNITPMDVLSQQPLETLRKKIQPNVYLLWLPRTPGTDGDFCCQASETTFYCAWGCIEKLNMT
jgi:hypothetical protein